MDTRINNGIHFKSGLTPQILRMEKNIKPKIVEKYFFNLPTKDLRSFYLTDFKNNKAMATANRLCADIFSNLRKILDYRAGYCSKNLIAPQDLYVYNKGDSESLIYITNHSNPFNDKFSIQYFLGRTKLGYEELPQNIKMSNL